MAYFSTLVLALTLLQQPRRQRVPPGGGLSDVPLNAVATFDGVFKTASKKFVEIQLPTGDTMRMYITKDTKFVKDGKTVASKAFEDGDKVTAEAERDARMNMLAVKIQSPPQPAEPAAEKK